MLSHQPLRLRAVVRVALGQHRLDDGGTWVVAWHTAERRLERGVRQQPLRPRLTECVAELGGRRLCCEVDQGPGGRGEAEAGVGGEVAEGYDAMEPDAWAWTRTAADDRNVDHLGVGFGESPHRGGG